MSTRKTSNALTCAFQVRSLILDIDNPDNGRRSQSKALGAHMSFSSDLSFIRRYNLERTPE
jgi:hypothetical protein